MILFLEVNITDQSMRLRITLWISQLAEKVSFGFTV